jgi:LuxR family maltose regulon positive regulatory protein
VADSAAAERRVCDARFAQSKLRPPTLPATLVTRPGLQDRLTRGSGQRLTVLVGSAGAGKSVLLSGWAAARPPGATSWLSCDRADANPVRFWAAFIEALRAVLPGFGADAAELLTMDRVVSADVTASLANDAAKLPAGSAIVVDDFDAASAVVRGDMTDLVERWPAETVQLVLSGRSDPSLRLHRLRMSGELCELRDHDLHFSMTESRDLLTRFGVQVGSAELALVHQRTEGWAAALQMTALTLRGVSGPERAAHAFEVRGQTIADYFVAEVLDRQPPEVARFMLDTSVLGELTARDCAAVTGQRDAASMLRSIDAANLFLVALNEERTSFRYHRLVRQVLHAELRTRDRARERRLQSRAAEAYEAAGDNRRAAHHFLAARQADRALTLLQDRVVPDFLRDPVLPAPLDPGMIAPSALADAPGRLLGLAADLLLWGDPARGGEYLDLVERARTPIPPGTRLAARYAAMRSFRYALTGQLNEAVAEARRARAIQQRAGGSDEWDTAGALILLRVHTCLEDYEAVEREAAAALAMSELTESAKQVLVPGAQAVAWVEAGHLARAAAAAAAAEAAAHRLGFDQHFFFAVDYLRALAGLALERRDLDTAERLTEQALSITERRRPLFEFLALLDRAWIWAARGQSREALATVEAARTVLAGTKSVLLARADAVEAQIRLSLGDLHRPAELAGRLPAAWRELLLARIALASGRHRTAREHLNSPALAELTPRRALVRLLLLATAAIECHDPRTASILAGALESARSGGFCHTVVAAAPQLTSYLVEHSIQMRADPFLEQLIVAALEVRAARPDAVSFHDALPEPLTAAEMRILKLLPTSTYLQMADTLYVSRNTVKTHLRSVYQKLGVTSRSLAIERAVELGLI